MFHSWVVVGGLRYVRVHVFCPTSLVGVCCWSLVHSPLPSRLQTDTRTGLSDGQVAERRAQYGFNQLDEKKVNPLLMFLSYFWGPMPCMIWVAALVELIKGSLGTCSHHRSVETVHPHLLHMFIMACVFTPALHSHAGAGGWEDFVVLMFLQFANATGEFHRISAYQVCVSCVCTPLLRLSCVCQW